MEVTGAQALLMGLAEEGVETIFGYPGGAALPIYDALCDSPIRHILTRHEQGAIHAAEGYARSTGRVGVVLATSGPGATNLITGLANAYMDSVPLVAITGQVPRPLIGKDAFQEADVVGITMPVTKHNYLVTEPQDLPRVIKEAFHIARTGRPGPVLIDVPKDVANSKIRWYWPEQVHLPGYKPTYVGHPAQIKKAVKAIKKCEKVVFLAGGGVVASNGASEALLQLAEKAQNPVVCTLQGLGGFPGDHPLAFGLIGMHGSFAANRAVSQCELLVAIGIRFDDRVTGMASRFAPRAQLVHIDIDPAEISKNLPATIPIVGDCRNVLEQMLEAIGDWQRPGGGAWLEQVNAWHDQHPLWGVRPRRPGAPAAPAERSQGIKPQVLLQTVQETFGAETIVCVDVGQHQMWTAHYCTRTQPRTFISSSGLGTMGFGLPAAVGAAIGNPDRQVVLVTGDGSIQMCIQELGTIAANNLPLKVVICNNQYLGMVRQWQQLFHACRYQHVDLRPGMPSFVKLCEAYGLKAMQVDSLDQLPGAMVAAKEWPGFFLVDVRVEEEANVFPIVPPGGANDELILEEQILERQGD